jgi:regulator of telomere elongation helicase 1
LKELYKVHICKEEKGEGGKGFLKGNNDNTILHLWCFSLGFSMQRLARLGARSIILTSGTLSPLQATAEEIGE